jgi:flagellar P-ring protein FlgI
VSMRRALPYSALVLGLFGLAGRSAAAQDARIRDLVLADAAPPTRLMGYGLVTGLNGTGDRVTGGNGSRQTVQSIVNLLRRFDVEVPAEVLRTRNVAAVLVTAEVSPYLRPGGRFEVRVSSVGDAQSLRGGVLWMTPLVADAGGRPMAGAQGALIVSGGETRTVANTGSQTTARVLDGGVLEAEMPRPRAAANDRLFLKDPDLNTAVRIAAVIDSALGAPKQALVEDPGLIRLVLKDTANGSSAALAFIRDLRIRAPRTSRVTIDARSGTIVAGGDISIGEATVSHGGLTLSIGGGSGTDTTTVAGEVRMAAGASVQKVASALRALQATATEIAAIFEALRDAGAIAAEVIVR